jgi:TonB family protein
MTPIKDTLEVASPVAEATTPQSNERPKSDAGQLRADAVSLDVAVKVHGSRVTEVIRGITPHSEPFEEQTSTMIVFPQGGVLRMATAVAPGQMVVLTNLKSGHDAICRVVKVRAYAQKQSYVELEFTNRQPGYWGVHFASDGAEPVKTFVPPPPPPAVAVVAEAPTENVGMRGAQEISWAPASTLQATTGKLSEPPVFSSPVRPATLPPERIVQPSKPESPFVSIGAREDVQPAASATSGTRKVERFTPPVASLSMTELRGDAHVAPSVSTVLGSGIPGEMTDLSEDLAESSQGQAAGVFGRLASTASSTGAHSASQKAFGARFDSTAHAVPEELAAAPKDSGPNWFLIATAIAALFVVGAGGAFYFHVWPAANSSASSASDSSPAAPSAGLSGTSNRDSDSGQTSASGPVAQLNQPSAAGAASGAVVASRVADAAPLNNNKLPSAGRVQPGAPVGQKVAKVIPDMSATLTAHPVSAQRSASDDADPAPSVEAGATSPNGELQGIAANSDVVPPPPPAVPPLRLGGMVRPPKLISSVLPVYPSIARTNGIEGNVVVDASVGPAGNVVSTRVISGPPVLRQAALDALRRWKYQPGTLNGQPLAVEIAVTIEFHK